MTLQEAVSNYIVLRDKLDAEKQAFKERTAKIEALKDKLEALIMTRLDAEGLESVRTEFGTAYKSLKTSATVADWDQVLPFILQHELWPMLERRVNKTVVEQYKQEHGVLPPGINWNAEYQINVRRS